MSSIHAHSLLLHGRVVNAVHSHSLPDDEPASVHAHAKLELFPTEFIHSHQHVHEDGTVHTHWHAHDVSVDHSADGHAHEHASLVMEFAANAAEVVKQLEEATVTIPQQQQQQQAATSSHTQSPKPEDPLEVSASCHQCKAKKPLSQLQSCTSSNMVSVRRETPTQRSPHARWCTKRFCEACLLRHWNAKKTSSDSNIAWTCPACLGVCPCAACRKRKAQDLK